jgi:hypothetical protein
MERSPEVVAALAKWEAHCDKMYKVILETLSPSPLHYMDLWRKLIDDGYLIHGNDLVKLLLRGKECGALTFDTSCGTHNIDRVWSLVVPGV